MNEHPATAPLSERSQKIHGLERKAEVMRARLFRAVDALDARRRQVVKIGTKAKSLALPAALGAVAVTGLFGASLVLFGLALRQRRQRSVTYRAKRVLGKALAGLELARRPSFFRLAAEKAVLALVSIAATELGKVASKNVVDGRFPDGSLALAGPRRPDIAVETIR